MVKAILIDHMGTLVYDQSEYLDKLVTECLEKNPQYDAKTILQYLKEKHDELSIQYNGKNYKAEYDIVCEAFDCAKRDLNLQGESQHYAQMLIDHWCNTPAFDDAYDFFEACELPIYILSNNDKKYVEASMNRLELKPAGIVSSDLTHYYKPSKEAFQKALELIGYEAQDIIYIGDSLGKDVKAAQNVGIQSYFIGKESVDDKSVKVIESLMDIFQYL